jgi:hypothetical protein
VAKNYRQDEERENAQNSEYQAGDGLSAGLL